jgi:hypothetical protein
MLHEKYSVTVSFILCDGLRDKVLEEVRQMQEHINKHCLSHASFVKVKVHHEEAKPEDMH